MVQAYSPGSAADAYLHVFDHVRNTSDVIPWAAVNEQGQQLVLLAGRQYTFSWLLNVPPAAHVDVSTWRLHKLDPLEAGDYLHVLSRHVRLWGSFGVSGLVSDIGT